ncbi:deoxycytidyl transferase [Malassezia vespertilionis]|uniref:DNA repair protein REV1 n=1 Tax=Malassezia vespertilionis TaxID=2020962 RepID=A0A2N1J7V5_9BASI|nr:deoxycytidyl transferase [Malassezia vespertilionis]PKI82630.1 Rev1p [Malassezia vespertilionis]WFD08465.1 deoxycytidyl transferase [Malassezia vespertilionis]
MAAPPHSSSSQLFSDDSSLLEALAHVVTPQASKAAPQTVHAVDSAPSSPTLTDAPPSPAAEAHARKSPASYMEGEAYSGVEFGEWGQYMRNKRAKLRVQQDAIRERHCVSDALQGCVIYINGRTQPPYAELRRMIMEHGGQVLPYLDQKGPCTHIVASSLTPRKVEAFRRYRVVLPSWIVECCRVRKKVDWTLWRCPSMDVQGHAPLFEKREEHAAKAVQRTAWRAQSVENDMRSVQLAMEKAEHESDDVQQSTECELNDGAHTPAAFHQRTAIPSDAQHDARKQLSSSPPPLPPAHSPSSAYYTGAGNQHAASLMASPSWRAEHTAANSEFLNGYYASSRLHHLSTWKSNLQDLVAQATTESARPPMDALLHGMARVIMHVDFDSFFVNVSLRSHSELRTKPVAVCHARQGDSVSSTSEIASCNYIARSFGVRNGTSLGHARKLCPDIHTLPYMFDAYYDTSLRFYTLLTRVADALEVASVDEALIDVSCLLASLQSGVCSTEPALHSAYEMHLPTSPTAAHALAEALRDMICDATQCTASIGIGANVLQARLATRRAKPNGAFHLEAHALESFMAPLQVRDLWGVGWSLCDRFHSWLGTRKVGEIIARTDEAHLVRQFGPKMGKTLWDKLHARDTSTLQAARARASVGAHISWGVRLSDTPQLVAFVERVCAEVAQRASRLELVGAQLSVQVMQRAKDAPTEAPKFLGHGRCTTHHRSSKLHPTCEARALMHAAWPLVQSLRIPPQDVRGLAVSLQRLQPMLRRMEQPRLAFPVLPSADAALEGSEASASSPPSPSFHIPPASQLDLDTVAQLPPAMRACIEARIEQNVMGASAAHFAAQAPHVPSASLEAQAAPLGLDAEVLAQLPTPLRHEILHAAAPQTPHRTAKRHASSSPRTPGFGQKCKKSPARRAHSVSPAKHATLAVSPPKNSAFPALHALAIDPDVFYALPAHVQADVYAEHMAAHTHKTKLRKEKAKAPERTAAQRRRHEAEAAVQYEANIRLRGARFPDSDPVVQEAKKCVGESVGRDPRASLVSAPSTHTGMLHPYLPLATFRDAVRDWYATCGHAAPNPADVARFECVLLACVRAQPPALGTISGMLAWLAYLVENGVPAWKEAYARVDSAVKEAVVAHVRGRLA